MDGSRDYSYCTFSPQNNRQSVEMIGNTVSIVSKFEIIITEKSTTLVYCQSNSFIEHFPYCFSSIGEMLVQPVYTITPKTSRHLKSKGVTTAEKFSGHAYAD